MQGRDDEDEDGGEPAGPAPGRIEPGGADGAGGSQEVVGRDPENGDRRRVRRLREQRRVHDRDDGEGDAERQAVNGLGARNAERHHEVGARPDEHQDPDGEAVRADVVREPCIPGVHPPRDRKDERGMAETGDAVRACHEPRHLRDREHEHEVEEQFECRDAIGRHDGFG